jgi:hypothetical protein
MQVQFATIFAGLLVAAAVVCGSTTHNNSAVYKPLYAVHSSSTSVFQNVSGQSANPLVRALEESSRNAGTCMSGIPCVSGACWSKVR